MSTTHPYAAVARQERLIAALPRPGRTIPGPRFGPIVPPLPVLSTPTAQRCHGGARVDSSYRLKDAPLWRELGWTAATTVRVQARHGGFLAVAHPEGKPLGQSGRLTVPQPVWRVLGLTPGTHVALIADLDAQRLVGIIPSFLNDLVVLHD